MKERRCNEAWNHNSLYVRVMQTLTDEQLNALPREAILILYRAIAQQLDAMEKA